MNTLNGEGDKNECQFVCTYFSAFTISTHVILFKNLTWKWPSNGRNVVIAFNFIIQSTSKNLLIRNEEKNPKSNKTYIFCLYNPFVSLFRTVINYFFLRQANFFALFVDFRFPLEQVCETTCISFVFVFFIILTSNAIGKNCLLSSGFCPTEKQPIFPRLHNPFLQQWVNQILFLFSLFKLHTLFFFLSGTIKFLFCWNK